MHTAALRRQQHGHGCNADCSFAERELQYIANKLVSSKLWPTSVRDVRQLGDNLRAMQDIKLDGEQLWNMPGVVSCGALCAVSRPRIPMHKELSELKEAACRIESDRVKLCYYCVLEGKPLNRECKHTASKQL